MSWCEKAPVRCLQTKDFQKEEAIKEDLNNTGDSATDPKREAKLLKRKNEVCSKKNSLQHWRTEKERPCDLIDALIFCTLECKVFQMVWRPSAVQISSNEDSLDFAWSRVDLLKTFLKKPRRV